MAKTVFDELFPVAQVIPRAFWMTGHEAVPIGRQFLLMNLHVIHDY
jgi:hypothetical protein